MRKSTTAERLKYILNTRSLKQADILKLAEPFVKQYGIPLNKNDLSQYVNGKVKPGQFKITILAKALNVNEAWLMGYDVPMSGSSNDSVDVNNIIPLPKTKMVPLVGTIACGTPILAEENIEDMVPMPEHIHADLALRCKGDSMINARILDNDIVYIRKQEAVENGEIAAVIIDNEATLKRFYRYGNTVILRAENPNYKEFEYSNEQINNIRILGKAVYFLSAVR